MGNLLGIVVHAANIHDTKSGILAAQKACKKYPSIQAFCADAGYRGTCIDEVKVTLHNSAARLAMSFPPSASCKFLDLPPVNLRNLHLHLTKNPFASRPPHLCGVTLKNLRNKPSSMGVSAPKGSRGRSESPLSPPQRRFPLAAIKTKKHGSAMRRFPKGDRKALWSPPQRRFPLAAIQIKQHR